ncbi:glycoside hydrolase family 2 TIM barrel-domain containing protein [uncultured Parabacteroides sp.]|uniref:glycoside hydrolase family 2 protein n=1 Tax=uncultured Parabacteroides sp. TaxID=512312 RepID=UPI0025DD59DE|nr:glycoside hydrolase family 2 TIM barrel-domain containing protein [uncultured Parabacteroides sp.]
MSVKKLLFLLSLTLFFNQGRAEDFVIPRISPLPIKVENRKVPLAGKWQFNPSPEKEFWKKGGLSNWKNIEVPGEWVMQGFEVEKGKAAGYYRTFTVPSSWNGQRVKLRCNGIYSDSRIYINGKEAGSHLGGFTPFELDITDWVETGKENKIAVSVRSESLADSTSSASQYAVHPLGGISRDIYLYALPDVNLGMFHASTSFDSTYTDATLKTEIEVVNESTTEAGQLTLQFVLKDASGKEIPLKKNSQPVRKLAAGATGKMEVSFDVANPHKWDSEHPYLYTLTCQLKDKQKVLHETTRRIGFRQVEVRGNQMYINNMPVKLRGVCRHEVMPLRGRSVNGDIWRQDVELFRRGNVNYIRTSHYPPDEALLEVCDELGMLIELEAPFCWAHNTKVPEDMHYAVLVNQHIEMVNLNRSHPSIIMWSMGNESNLFTEYFKKASEVVKQIDPTRPRIFSQWGPDADNGELEVTNHHYPGPTGPDKYRDSKRPVTFDEFCHLNAYNRLELAADPGLRSMWGVLLDRMWTDMYRSEGVLGGAIWAGINDTFFLPGEKAVGYGTWGPIDGWRREKPEYWGMKKAFSPVKIEQKGNMSADGRVCFHVENRHNFSNLSECRIEWSVGGQKGKVTVDVAPRSEGEFEIQLPESLYGSGQMELTVTGVRGFVVDEYHFDLLPVKAESKRESKTGRLVCEENAGSILIRSVGGEFTIDKRNGLLSAERERKKIIRQSPSLMVLPLNPHGEGIQMTGKDQNFTPFNPVCKNWVAHSVSCISTDDQVTILVKGSYKEAEGVLEYCFHNDGELVVTYDFTMLQEVSPRQTGLVFTLPASFTDLSWERKGYWSVYPKDHIGGLKGSAKAFNDELPVSGVAGPSRQPSVSWSMDQTAAGSNIFRSTKENIYSAKLSNTAGDKLSVVSDGTQHVRAWLDQDVVRFLVAGYNNAGNENFLISHAEKEYRPLRRGDKIQGKIRVSF